MIPDEQMAEDESIASQVAERAGQYTAMLPISCIRQDGGTQPRAVIRADWIGEYSDDLLDGATFPPVTAFFDGSYYWLADGFHRTCAARAIGRTEIEVNIRQGSRRDALLYSLTANAQHGHRRTNEDKRRAVDVMLNDPEWSTWSNREVARQCGVDESTVRVRRDARLSAGFPQIETRIVTRAGSTYEMRTADIGQHAVVLDDQAPAGDDHGPAEDSPFQPTDGQLSEQVPTREPLDSDLSVTSTSATQLFDIQWAWARADASERTRIAAWIAKQPGSGLVLIREDLRTRARALAEAEGIDRDQYVDRAVDDAVTHAEAANAELDEATERLPRIVDVAITQADAPRSQTVFAQVEWIDNAPEPPLGHVQINWIDPDDNPPDRSTAYVPRAQIMRELKEAKVERQENQQSLEESGHTVVDGDG